MVAEVEQGLALVVGQGDAVVGRAVVPEGALAAHLENLAATDKAKLQFVDAMFKKEKEDVSSYFAVSMALCLVCWLEFLLGK